MDSKPELEHGGEIIMLSDETVAKRRFAIDKKPIEAYVFDSLEVREAERNYVRKLDLIILPTISALYFFEYIDRGNIANAKLYRLDTGHGTAKQGVGPGKTPL